MKTFGKIIKGLKGRFMIFLAKRTSLSKNLRKNKRTKFILIPTQSKRLKRKNPRILQSTGDSCGKCKSMTRYLPTSPTTRAQIGFMGQTSRISKGTKSTSEISLDVPFRTSRNSRKHSFPTSNSNSWKMPFDFKFDTII